MHVENIYVLDGDFLNPLPLCSLIFYSLSGNEISDEGMGALAGALQVNQSLQKLE